MNKGDLGGDIWRERVEVVGYTDSKNLEKEVKSMKGMENKNRNRKKGKGIRLFLFVFSRYSSDALHPRKRTHDYYYY